MKNDMRRIREDVVQKEKEEKEKVRKRRVKEVRENAMENEERIRRK